MNKTDNISNTKMSNTEKEVLSLRDSWYEEAKKIGSLEELNAFNKKLYNDFEKEHGRHDYNTMCYAATASAIAATSLYSRNYGMTGFQMSCVMWDLIQNIGVVDDECGLKLVEYSKMLYPQYDYVFEKEISRDTWELLQQRAKEILEKDGKFMAVRVKEHMQSIVNGKVPFGYKVRGQE